MIISDRVMYVMGIRDAIKGIKPHCRNPAYLAGYGYGYAIGEIQSALSGDI